MDFKDEILKYKNSSFGILWHYGNKDINKKICVPKELRKKFEIRELFQFIRTNKDVLNFQEWSILFKGLFFILYLKFDFIYKEFELFNTEIDKKSKPTFNEYEDNIKLAKLIEKNFAESQIINLTPIEPISKSTRRTINAKLSIKETLDLAETDNDVDWENINRELADDGFGATLQTNRQNIDEFFDFSNASVQRSDLFDYNSETIEQFMDTDPYLPSLHLSPTSSQRIQMDTSSTYLTSRSKTIIGDPKFAVESPKKQARDKKYEASSISGELPSVVLEEDDDTLTFKPLITSPLYSPVSDTPIEKSKDEQYEDNTIFGKLSFDIDNIDDKTLTPPLPIPVESPRKQYDVTDIFGELSFDADKSSTSNQDNLLRIREYFLDENRRSDLQISSQTSLELPPLENYQRRRRRRRDHINESQIIDEIVIFDDENYFIKLQKYHDKQKLHQLLTAQRLHTSKYEFRLNDAFKTPLNFNSIEPVTNYYITERRNTDRLEIQIPDTDSEIEKRRGIKRKSTLDDELTECTTDDLIELIVKDVMDDILDRLSLDLELDEPRSKHRDSRTTLEQSSRYSEREEYRDGTSGQYYSSFEPVSIQEVDEFQYGDEENILLQPLNDNTSCLDDRTGTDFLNTNQNLNFSYVQTINGLLEERKDGIIAFSDLTLNFKRSEAAKCFSDLLEMKMRRTIELVQTDTYDFGQIYIRRIDSFFDDMSDN